MVNWTQLQKAKQQLEEADEAIMEAERELILEAGNDIAWHNIKKKMGIEDL